MLAFILQKRKRRLRNHSQGKLQKHEVLGDGGGCMLRNGGEPLKEGDPGSKDAPRGSHERRRELSRCTRLG